jgi:hypothetical protein
MMPEIAIPATNETAMAILNAADPPGQISQIAGRRLVSTSQYDPEERDRTIGSAKWMGSCREAALELRRRFEKSRKLPRRLVVEFDDPGKKVEPVVPEKESSE